MQLTSTNYYSYSDYRLLLNSNSDYIDKEVWTDIVGNASNYYEVSNLGRFRSKIDIMYLNSSRFGKKEILYIDIMKYFYLISTQIHILAYLCTFPLNKLILVIIIHMHTD